MNNKKYLNNKGHNEKFKLFNMSLKYFLSLSIAIPSLGSAQTQPSGSSFSKDAIPLAVINDEMRAGIDRNILFDVNDVSYLWPVPKNENDLNSMISGSDLIGGSEEEKSNKVCSFLIKRTPKI